MSVSSLREDGGVLVKKVLIVPDRLTLSEMLTQFREAHEDFAVVVNEYKPRGGRHHAERCDEHRDGQPRRAAR